MAVWRRRALELFPELRFDLQQRDTSIYQLFTELLIKADQVHEATDFETLHKVYSFAEWSLRQRTGELRNAAAVGFYEHLVDRRDRRIWADMLRWLPGSIIAQIWPLWQWRLAEHEEGVLRDLIAHPDLTPPLSTRRTVDPAPVTIRPGIVDLGTLGGAASHAWAINGAGVVVGWAETASRDRRAVSWSDGSLTDLGTLGGGQSGALAINDAGVIAGWAETADGATHAALWAGERPRDLGTLGGRDSIALAINARGQAVGWARVEDGARHAVLWDQGSATDLGTLGGRESVALAINAGGTVVGWAETAAGEMRAVRWERGQPITLAPLGGRDSSAVAINDRGWITGWAEVGDGVDRRDERVTANGAVETGGWITLRRDGGPTADATRHAALWIGAQVSDLGTLGGKQSEAAAINAAGEVVGWAKVPGEEAETFFDVGWAKTNSGKTAATRWVRGRAIDLCPTGLWSQATALNDAGEAVGWVRSSGGGTRAFRGAGGILTDLGTLGGTESIAVAINAAGVAVGRAETADRELRAVLWTPADTAPPRRSRRWLRLFPLRQRS